MTISSELLSQLEWRCIGPHRGGRVVAVAGDPAQMAVFYFGSTGGGVWKTTDGGQYWENVSDGFFKRASVGGLAVAPSDPNVIYAGMGETTIRGNVSHGDGVYKSTDAGKTWTHLGLAATRNIAKVRVHPANPDLVYVAAFGHAHGPNQERGLYRSADGGATWELVLSRGENAGACDIALDPGNPRTIYAAFWEARRGPYSLSSGGPGSGLFKSNDGGTTWIELTGNPGLPKGLKGKIGVAVAPGRPGRVWAIVEAEEGGVFRSDDGGASWERVNEERALRQRAWYYSHIYADPQDPETVWVLNVETWRSIDGGKTFARVAAPHGDNHDLWIDPHDPRRMILGHDGGASVTFNGGLSWSSPYNQPTAEFYHVTTDSRTPYRVYGAQQDNTTMSVPSRSNYEAITTSEWYEVGGGESGYIAVRPDDPNIIYAGNYLGYLTRYDHARGHLRNITVWPEEYSGWGAKDMKYRFQWTSPVLLSPHDPNVLYSAGNIIFRSTDEGTSWTAISPDLTRNDPTTQEPSGGPITKDNTGAEVYATVFALAESPLERGLLWAGSDDGLVHLSRDDGANWTNVTPPELPEWALISIIEPSPHDPAVAYIAATRYKHDDFRPYLYKTSDYGQTWTPITTGIPEDSFTRVIRADPGRRGLLYAGTETGLYISFDDGANWQSGNPVKEPVSSQGRPLPVVPIHDLVVKDDDLVVATHGRSFWILDDLTLLQQMTETTVEAPVHLFQPRDTCKFGKLPSFGHEPVPGKNYAYVNGLIPAYSQTKLPDGETRRAFIDAGTNAPDGVIVNYVLKEPYSGKLTLTFLDAQGQEIKTFSSKDDPEKQKETAQLLGEDMPIEDDKEPKLTNRAGLNRFVWNMRYPDAQKITSGLGDKDVYRDGPHAPPGTYQVRLTVGEQTFTQPFAILKDPRTAVADADLAAQFALLRRIRDTLDATHTAINRIRAIQEQVDGWRKRTKETPAGPQIAEAAKKLKEQLATVEEQLIQVKARSSQDTLNYPAMLNAKLGVLSWIVGSADSAPTQQAQALFEDLAARFEEQRARLAQTIETEVAAFNRLIQELAVPAVVVAPAEDKTS